MLRENETLDRPRKAYRFNGHVMWNLLVVTEVLT